MSKEEEKLAEIEELDLDEHEKQKQIALVKKNAWVKGCNNTNNSMLVEINEWNSPLKTKMTKNSNKISKKQDADIKQAAAKMISMQTALNCEKLKSDRQPNEYFTTPAIQTVLESAKGFLHNSMKEKRSVQGLLNK